MASRFSISNEEDDDIMRLSNHISSINLILDMIDISALRRGSLLEKGVARQLRDLRSRIKLVSLIGGSLGYLQDAFNGEVFPGSATFNCAQDHLHTQAQLKQVQQTQLKNCNQSPAPAESQRKHAERQPEPTASEQNLAKIQQQKELKEQRLKQKNAQAVQTKEGIENCCNFLAKRKEKNNFKTDGDHFYCILCRKNRHWIEVLGHVEGKRHVDSLKVKRLVLKMIDAKKPDRERLMWRTLCLLDEEDSIDEKDIGFHCFDCDMHLNGPIPVIDHVRGSSHGRLVIPNNHAKE